MKRKVPGCRWDTRVSQTTYDNSVQPRSLPRENKYLLSCVIITQKCYAEKLMTKMYLAAAGIRGSLQLGTTTAYNQCVS